MNYPLISDYLSAIQDAEDNFKELNHLRAVIGEDGLPIFTSGNFAVVFKMRDVRSGKLHAVKCFLKEQEEREERYRLISEELKYEQSAFLTPMRYLSEELFVDSNNCTEEEFPVVLMDWVEGINLEAYIRQYQYDSNRLNLLSYQFGKLASWLISQPFAHGDLKPDNILVTQSGSLVLIDYDGMFVTAMQGMKAHELGSPDYRHPLRHEKSFDEHIDDFSLAVLALTLKALSLNPTLLNLREGLLFTESDYRDLSKSRALEKLRPLLIDIELTTLYTLFFLAYTQQNLSERSSRLFLQKKPKINELNELSTKVTEDDLTNGIEDEHGAIYSANGIRLLKCENSELRHYEVKKGPKIICDKAFVPIYYTDVVIESLLSITLPDSIISIGEAAFCRCESLESIILPDSITSIGNYAFYECTSLRSITLPHSITSIGEQAFWECTSLRSIILPDLITSIGVAAFSKCTSLQSIILPDSITSIREYAFSKCTSLQSVTLPNSITSIGGFAFIGCTSLKSIIISKGSSEKFKELLPDYTTLLHELSESLNF